MDGVTDMFIGKKQDSSKDYLDYKCAKFQLHLIAKGFRLPFNKGQMFFHHGLKLGGSHSLQLHPFILSKHEPDHH